MNNDNAINSKQMLRIKNINHDISVTSSYSHFKLAVSVILSPVNFVERFDVEVLLRQMFLKCSIFHYFASTFSHSEGIQENMKSNLGPYQSTMMKRFPKKLTAFKYLEFLQKAPS